MPVARRRLKANVTLIGKTVYDLDLYKFRYLDDSKFYTGVMAQDVLKVYPQAVSVGAENYLYVDYNMLGIRMEECANAS